MAENEQNQSATKPVDEAPISPIERKNSLENHLQHRPDRAELVDSMLAPLPVLHSRLNLAIHCILLYHCATQSQESKSANLSSIVY